MKRIMLIITALLLVLSCSATVFAEDTATEDNSDGNGFGGVRVDLSDTTEDDVIGLQLILEAARKALEDPTVVTKTWVTELADAIYPYFPDLANQLYMMDSFVPRSFANFLTDFAHNLVNEKGGSVSGFPLGDGQTEFDLGNGYKVKIYPTCERGYTTIYNGVSYKFWELRTDLIDPLDNVIEYQYGIQGACEGSTSGELFSDFIPILDGDKFYVKYKYIRLNGSGWSLQYDGISNPLTIPDLDNVEITEKTEDDSVENLTDNELLDFIDKLLEELEDLFPDTETAEGLLQAILNKLDEILNKLDKQKDIDLSGIISRLDRLIELMKENNDLLGAIKELSEEEKEEENLKWLDLISDIKKKVDYDDLKNNIDIIQNELFGERIVTADINTNTFTVTANNVSRSFVPQLNFTFLGHEYNLFAYIHAVDPVTLSTVKAFISFLLQASFLIGLFRSLPDIISNCGRVISSSSVGDSIEVNFYRDKYDR